MITVGQILQEAREKQQLGFEELSHKTKIREEFLQAMESNAFEVLPKGPFVRGFLSTYARELGLDAERLLAVYRRDFGKDGEKILVPKGAIHPIRKKIWLSVTPGVLAIGVVLTLILGFIGYEWYAFAQPPQISLAVPVEDQQTKSPVEVRGHTATDAVVLVNTQPVSLDQDGNFRTEVEFSPGEHAVIIEAKNRQGKSSVVQRIIHIVE